MSMKICKIYAYMYPPIFQLITLKNSRFYEMLQKFKCNFSMKHVNIIYLNVIRNTKNVIFIFGSHITIFAFVIMIIWCNLNNGWNVGRRCILSQIEIFFATNIMSLRYYHFMSKTLPNNISELNVLWFHLTIIYKEFWQE